MLNKKALAASVSAAVEKTYVEDVFSTYLYDGNAAAAGDTNVINNGIDLSGKGGMVWIKCRSAVSAHGIFDTVRGVTKSLTSSSTAVEATDSLTLTSFNSNGFTLSTASLVNDSSRIYTSWSFRKTEKFFDVVTYTGNETNRTIAHNLGAIPGCIMVKSVDVDGGWWVYHRDIGNTKNLRLNATNAAETDATFWNSTTPTSTVFSLGTSTTVNQTGTKYIAYLFANDAGGFGSSGDQNIITCGSYVGNGSTNGPNIDLGYEAQWVLIKQSSVAGEDWMMLDINRGMSARDAFYSRANSTAAEVSAGATLIRPTPTGFQITADLNWPQLNTNNATYVYIAIRRGPMKTPTDATKVFQPVVYTGTNVDNRLINTTIAPDFVMIRQRNDTVVPGMYTGARLTGNEYLITDSTAIGATDADSFDAQIVSTVEYGNAFSSMSGVWVGNDATRKFNANTTSNNHIIEAFKRAPGFFDVVCYTGTSANRTVSHNLGVAPEMMWVKRRSVATNAWRVYSQTIGNTKYLVLDDSAQEATGSTVWNNTSPTSSVFTVGTDATVNTSGSAYIAFLFASCPGVSKVGSYTGNGGSEFSDGTSQTIDCGFASSARFVLIKKTNFAGDWYLFDSARGIVTADDPYLLLNSTAAEVTNLDVVDTSSSGFVVNQLGGTNLNVTNHTYIYLAIS